VEHSARHTVLFTAGLCVFFSVIVSAVSVGLKDRQVENQRIDKIKNVLRVAGLLEPGEKLTNEEINRRFATSLEPRLVNLASGAEVEGGDALAFNQRKAARDPAQSRPAPANTAKVRRIPDQALIFVQRDGDEVSGLILPIEGYGLWSTLYGYIALEADARTIRGITFYEQGETAGLGGEVDNPRWKALWPGRLAFDENWVPRIRVIKGAAGPPEEDPFRVDGLSGATLTSNGVTNMLRFWLGENGFGPFLAEYRKQRGIG